MEKKAKRTRRRASFLKLIDGDFLKQMPIPRNFTKNFDGEVPDWLIVEIAGTRKCWRVDVKEDEDGRLHFTDGWDDFVEANTLEVGNFLLFEYKGQLILEVTTFDKDGSEKIAGLTSESEEYDVEDAECRHKTLKTHHTEEASSPSARTCLGVLLADSNDKFEKQQKEVDTTKQKIAGPIIIGDGEGFSITWREANHYYYYLTIPRLVAVENKLSSRNQGMALKDQAGKIWPIQVRTRPDGRVDFTHGWREFVCANKIRAGDTLTFEFSSDNLIEVHVESPSRVDHPSQSPKDCRDEHTETIVASEPVERAPYWTSNYKAPEASAITERVFSASKKSSFSITWTLNTRTSYLHIPKKVAQEQNLQHGSRVVICDQEGREWQHKVNIRRSDGRFTLRGWSVFCAGNEIHSGDTLVFEFVADCIMNVSIIRASQVPCAVAFEGSGVKQELVGIE